MRVRTRDEMDEEYRRVDRIALCQNCFRKPVIERWRCERCLAYRQRSGNERPLSRCWPKQGKGDCPDCALLPRHGLCARCREARRRAAQLRNERSKLGILGNRERVPQPGDTCPICGYDGGKRGLVLDHDHTSGLQRGFLCHRCNMGLGQFADDPGLLRMAAEYLERIDNRWDA